MFAPFQVVEFEVLESAAAQPGTTIILVVHVAKRYTHDMPPVNMTWVHPGDERHADVTFIVQLNEDSPMQHFVAHRSCLEKKNHRQRGEDQNQKIQIHHKSYVFVDLRYEEATKHVFQAFQL